MTRFSIPFDRRFGAAVVTIVIELALALILIHDWGGSRPAPVIEALKTFDVIEAARPKPQVKQAPRPKRAPRRNGAASPPNLRAVATQIVAPPVVLPMPPPMAASRTPDAGGASASGSAAVSGPGTGSGGQGNGRGSGDGGDGDGGGGDDGGTPPIHRRGDFKDSDYPGGAGEAGVSGTVGVRYVVGVDGHASDCEVTRSSGNPELDSVTCRVIVERFRFDPSRDERGTPVPAYLVENHSWIIRDTAKARR